MPEKGKPWLPTRQMWQYFNAADWGSDEVSREKALYCSIIAKIAYFEIPEFERANLARVSVIPCVDFRELVSQGIRLTLAEVLTDADIPILFVVQQPFLTAVGLRQDGVLFIAIRGTMRLYDWAVNLDCRKHFIGKSSNSYGFHKGFYDAANMLAGPLTREIQNATYSMASPRIVFCGHSLGGAIASILMADDGNFFDEVTYFHRPGTHYPTACYSYGAPRFATDDAIDSFQMPFAFVRPTDIVPTVPPSWMNFGSLRRVFNCDCSLAIHEPNTPLSRFGGWLTSLATGTGVAEHDIERYIADLSSRTAL